MQLKRWISAKNENSAGCFSGNFKENATLENRALKKNCGNQIRK